MPQEIISERLKENPFVKLNDAVYEHLREQIISLAYESGMRLVESQLAEELKVSHSPIIAALQRLQEEKRPSATGIV